MTEIHAVPVHTGVRAGRVRLDFIDMLRAVAVLAVFALHARAFWVSEDVEALGLLFVVDRIAAQGAAGVDLFIVLSGFCMTYPLLRGTSGVARISAARFYRRRAIRLLPAYYAALAVVVCVLLIPDLQPRMTARPVEPLDVLFHSLLVQPFDPERVGAINGPLWSISLEVTLYLVFPLGLLLLRRFGWAPLVGGSIALALAWYGLIDLVQGGEHDQWAQVMEFWLPGHYFEFVLGMLAADLLCRPRSRQTMMATIALPCAALVGAVGTVTAVGAARTLGWGVAAFALTVAAGGWSGSHRLSWLARTGTRLGLVSYSFYLLHQPFLLLTSGMVRDTGLSPLAVYALAVPIGLLGMYAVALAFFRLFERPFLNAGSMRDAIKD